MLNPIFSKSYFKIKSIYNLWDFKSFTIWCIFYRYSTFQLNSVHHKSLNGYIKAEATILRSIGLEFNFLQYGLGIRDGAASGKMLAIENLRLHDRPTDSKSDFNKIPEKYNTYQYLRNTELDRYSIQKRVEWQFGVKNAEEKFMCQSWLEYVRSTFVWLYMDSCIKIWIKVLIWVSVAQLLKWN